jgi:hypothetical protein
MPDFDLHLAPPPDRNKLVPKVLIASVVMIMVGAAVYLLNPRKTAEFAVKKVSVFAPHTEMKAVTGIGHVIGQAASTEDDLYIVATVSVTDKLRLPIFLEGHSANMTTADGSTIEATVVAPSELPHLEETFPQILPLVSPPEAQPINVDDAIAPGTTRVGSVVLLFPQISAQAWQTKKSATLTLELEHDASPLTVALP